MSLSGGPSKGHARDDTTQVAAQILSFNAIAVLLVVVSSCFAQRRTACDPLISTSRRVLDVLAVVNAVVLGTNSFAVRRPDEPLIPKLVEFLAPLPERHDRYAAA